MKEQWLNVFFWSLTGGALGASCVLSYLFFRIEYLANKIKKLEEQVVTLEIQVAALHAQYYLPERNDE